MPASPEFRPLPGLIASARDRWALVGAFALVGLILGYAAASLLPVTYTATTTLQIATESGSNNAPSVISPADAENIAMLAPQLDTIAEQFGDGLTGKDVKDLLTVVNRPGTSLLDFTWSGPTAADAERGADIASKVYLARAQELMGAAVPGQPPAARAPAGIELMGADGRAELSGLPPFIYVPVGVFAGLLLGFIAAYVAEVRRPRVHARYHLGVSDPRFRGRIGRTDSPSDVAMLFMVPVRPADQVGIAVLGRRPEQLDAFSEAAIAIAEGSGVRSVVPVDASSVSGLRAAREFDGVFLLAREQQVSTVELEATLARLEAASVSVFGVLTVAPRAGSRVQAQNQAEIRRSSDPGAPTGRGPAAPQDTSAEADSGPAAWVRKRRVPASLSRSSEGQNR